MRARVLDRMRAYHSASSDALGIMCERAWWHRYHDGIKEAEVPWSTAKLAVWDRKAGKPGSYGAWVLPDGSTIEPRQRSTSIGKEMHSRLEGFYRGKPTAWNDLPGKIAMSGLHHLPGRKACIDGDTERELGKVFVPDKYGGKHGIKIDGVVWVGSRDLVARVSRVEAGRMGVDVAKSDGWILLDYKSSKSIEEYALTPDGLYADVAANLYAYATCLELDLPEVPARWVYFETKLRRIAAPIDAVIGLAEATDRVHEASARARHLDLIQTEKDAKQNLDACDEYGGCPYHVDRGGPCKARRSVGSLLVTRKPKKEEGKGMALTAAQQAKFDQKKAEAAAKAAEPEETEEETEETDDASDESPKSTKKKAPGPGRGKKKAKAEEPAAEAPAGAELITTTTFQGDHGPVTASGDMRDLLRLHEILNSV